ncbi:hypothetical protein B0T17DRAFT_486498 [Bombardia bombarda]|uniref:F-box domain-containing protein n=1 Tax=Bombardia bombarda TaxID=252184 RepID=A0AA39XAX2_9PEZI|nr:hypothetical protein B0T17DRAFT_486498 [Bombardia bombarda]
MVWRPTGAISPDLPQEIWLLVAQELANRRDFPALFTCARLSRSWANLALPLLYSIHEMSPASNADDITDIETSVGLWRSIIASSHAKTLYPYCHWIKALMLGNLYTLLEDLARDSAAELRALFFSPPLQHLRIRRGNNKGLNLDAIIVEVANSVTACIRHAADQQDKVVGLTSLEGPHLPSANLPGWVSCLSRLTSLTVRDGSVLNARVAQAIRKNCPAFKEVVCLWCQGTDIDVTLAGFFQCLGPNTLESFTVNSMNEIGEHTFQALSGHALSLKRLGLFSLKRSAFESLNRLGDCRALESLNLEASSDALHLRWDGPLQHVFSEVVQWLGQCTRLEELEFVRVPGATTILGQVLKSPDVRLTNLNLKSDDFDEEFYRSLCHQQSLRQLMVRIVDDDVLEAGEVRRMLFVDALCHCRELRELDTNEMFTLDEFDRITTAAPTLEEIVSNGELIDNSFFLPLLRLKQLKSLIVFGPSSFTVEGIHGFLKDLEADPEARHEGIQLYVAAQNWELKFSPQEESGLMEEIRRRFGGKLDIAYRPDPDEMHESDFDNFSD